MAVRNSEHITTQQPIREFHVSDREPPPLKSEISTAINKLNNRKSPGADGIPAELYKHGGPVMIEVIRQLCIEVWGTGEWPVDWTKSVFIPRPKKGDLSVYSNYRTISLVSHASKILLSVIMARIQNQVNRVIPDVQAGFRAGRGTRDEIVNLRLIIEKARDLDKPSLRVS